MASRGAHFLKKNKIFSLFCALPYSTFSPQKRNFFQSYLKNNLQIMRYCLANLLSAKQCTFT